MTQPDNPMPAPATSFVDPLVRGLPAPHAKQVAMQILAGHHLSVLATTNADGSPQMGVIFVKVDADDILFSTLKGRRKTVNMMRDPRSRFWFIVSRPAMYSAPMPPSMAPFS